MGNKLSGDEAAQTDAWELPWRQVPGSGSVIGVAVLRDGTLLGIGTDHQLYTAQWRQAPAEPLPAMDAWALVPGSGSVIAITELYDGTLLGVGMDNALWTRAALAGTWAQVPDSKAVKSVTQLHDGSLLGVGIDNALWTRATLASPWVQVPDSTAVASVAQLADGRLVGIGMDRRAYSRAMLTDAWVPLAVDGVELAALTQLPDRTLLGVGTDTLLYLLPDAQADATAAGFAAPADEAAAAESGLAPAAAAPTPADAKPSTALACVPSAPRPAPVGDALPQAVQIANIVKLAGESSVLPGFSLLVDGKVAQGVAHAALGLAALRILGATAGPVGWLLLAANSYSQSVSGKHLHQHVKELF